MFLSVSFTRIYNVSSKKAVKIKKVIKKNKSFYIDIKGYVKNPGVYKVNSNNIVNDAINLAGGLLKEGTTLNINLSKKLESEMVIIIRKKSSLQNDLNTNHTCVSEDVDYSKCLKENKNVSIISSNKNNNSDDNENKIININTANSSQLQTLPSIGEAKAQKIIDYRNSFGNFNSIEDIKKVSGIGEALFAKIKEYITV